MSKGEPGGKWQDACKQAADLNKYITDCILNQSNTDITKNCYNIVEKQLSILMRTCENGKPLKTNEPTGRGY